MLVALAPVIAMAVIFLILGTIALLRAEPGDIAKVCEAIARWFHGGGL